MSKQPQKKPGDKKAARRIVIQLSPREKDDPKSILSAVRDAARRAGCPLEVRTKPDPQPAEPPPASTPQMADEQTEARLVDWAEIVLKAAQEDAEKAAAQPKNDPVTWWTRVKALTWFVGQKSAEAGIKFVVETTIKVARGG